MGREGGREICSSQHLPTHLPRLNDLNSYTHPSTDSFQHSYSYSYSYFYLSLLFLLLLFFPADSFLSYFLFRSEVSKYIHSSLISTSASTSVSLSPIITYLPRYYSLPLPLFLLPILLFSIPSLSPLLE